MNYKLNKLASSENHNSMSVMFETADSYLNVLNHIIMKLEVDASGGACEHTVCAPKDRT